MSAGFPQCPWDQQVANAKAVVAAHNAWPAIERILNAAKKWSDEIADGARVSQIEVDLLVALAALEAHPDA